MTMPALQQTVESPAEELALQVAKCLCEEGQAAANALFKKLCEQHRLTRGEAAAFSHVAICMANGKAWKKNKQSN